MHMKAAVHKLLSLPNETTCIIFVLSCHHGSQFSIASSVSCKWEIHEHFPSDWYLLSQMCHMYFWWTQKCLNNNC